MANATRTTVSTFGVVAGIAGLEHGIGEMLQGNVAPEGVTILSWPRDGLFRVLGGEPAMTVVPNLLATGLLATLVSLVFVLWTIRFVRGRYGAPVLMALSLLWLLVGGGFGPPILGLILGLAATGINSPLRWWRSHLPAGMLRFLARLWLWCLIGGVAAWLVVMPGTFLLDLLIGMEGREGLVYGLILSAFTLLLLCIIAALAHDAEQKCEPDDPEAVMG